MLKYSLRRLLNVVIPPFQLGCLSPDNNPILDSELFLIGILKLFKTLSITQGSQLNLIPKSFLLNF